MVKYSISKEEEKQIEDSEVVFDDKSQENAKFEGVALGTQVRAKTKTLGRSKSGIEWKKKSSRAYASRPYMKKSFETRIDEAKRLTKLRERVNALRTERNEKKRANAQRAKEREERRKLNEFKSAKV